MFANPGIRFKNTSSRNNQTDPNTEIAEIISEANQLQCSGLDQIWFYFNSPEAPACGDADADADDTDIVELEPWAAGAVVTVGTLTVVDGWNNNTD